MRRRLPLTQRLRAAAVAFRDGPTAAEDDSRLADYPPPYPRGWYRVACSDDVRAGTVLRVSCLGRRFVVFRGEVSARVGVLDAFCPHQGADLGEGGCVVGDAVRCPFHHWTFDASGALTAAPGAKRLPRAEALAYDAREHDGMIWIFFDAAAPGCRAPYEPEVHEDVRDGDLVFAGEHRHDDVRMHLIEFAENSVDFQHFDPLHGRMVLPWTRIPVPFVSILHRASWETDVARPHVAYFHDEAQLAAFGRAIPRTDARARITLFGPGGVVYFRFHIPDVGQLLLYQTHTPVAPLRQRVYFRWYAARSVPRSLASYVVGNWVSQWRADVSIWENKIYRKKPVLSSADGPVHRMRRWYQQFYDPPAGTASDAPPPASHPATPSAP